MESKTLILLCLVALAILEVAGKVSSTSLLIIMINNMQYKAFILLIDYWKCRPMWTMVPNESFAL